VGNKSPVDKTQVELVGVVWVWQNSDNHSATGNAIALELVHLISRWCEVACGAECFPRKAWKTLLVQPVGTDRTISVQLVKHGESHLYKNVIHVRSQRERHVKW
jgi:transcriptional regulator of acetoin/glycerol metabolism